MALTVGEILNMEEFREYRVLCGKRGLAQEVSNVTVMDTPNPQEWTRPGELVVSSGFILQQNVPDLVSFVRKLAQTEACALFLKLGAYLPQPVSYTHLDVYKRQLLPCIPPATFRKAGIWWSKPDNPPSKIR